MISRVYKTTATLVLALIIMSCEVVEDENATGVTDINATHQVLAFNDLGMHCADLDYSTFVILPPFNVIHSQVIERGDKPRIL
ncbi:MAG: cytochrome C, partial [Gammaproteobacteria bacterium]